MTSPDMMIIHLVRAFLTNPEVMVLHKPLRLFAPTKMAKVMTTMREHVDARGVGLPAEHVELRRPRTIFYSTENVSQVACADVIWRLKRDVRDEPTQIHTRTVRDLEKDAFDAKIQDTGWKFTTRRDIDAQAFKEMQDKIMLQAVIKLQCAWRQKKARSLLEEKKKAKKETKSAWI